jgi:hypothetical protein
MSFIAVNPICLRNSVFASLWGPCLVFMCVCVGVGVGVGVGL